MTVCDRRAWPRSRCLHLHGGHAARVRTGHDVQVLDLSSGGALVEGTARMIPDSVIELRFPGTAPSRSIRGRVVRCYVSAVHAEAVYYRAAVAFDHSVDLSQMESPPPSNNCPCVEHRADSP